MQLFCICFFKGVQVHLTEPVNGHSDFLIHKGNNFGGEGGQTIIEVASNMSDNWSTDGDRKTCPEQTIGKLIDAGGTEYKVWGKNCQNATDVIEN